MRAADDSGDRHGHNPRRMSFGLRPDDNLDVAIQESDEAQQPFGGKPAELVVLEFGDGVTEKWTATTMS
jgi:hypothetical protein